MSDNAVPPSATTAVSVVADASVAQARRDLLALYRDAADGMHLHYARLLVHLEETIARTRADGAGGPEGAPEVALPPISRGGVDLDPQRSAVRLPGERDGGDTREVHLTPQETRLLHLLMREAGNVLTVAHLQARAWGPGAHVQSQQVRQHVMALRRKIEPDPTQCRYVVTVPGIGYTFIAPEEDEHVD